MGIFLRLLLLAFVLALLWRLLKMGLKQIGMRQSQQLDARDGVSQTSAQDSPHEVMVGCWYGLAGEPQRAKVTRIS